MINIHIHFVNLKTRIRNKNKKKFQPDIFDYYRVSVKCLHQILSTIPRVKT